MSAQREEFAETLAFYEYRLKLLTLEEQNMVNSVTAAIEKLVSSTGQQGVIAAGLFTFRNLLKHFPES